MSNPNPKAFPLADETLTNEILDLTKQASHYAQLKKGANEGVCLPSNDDDGDDELTNLPCTATKTLNRGHCGIHHPHRRHRTHRNPPPPSAVVRRQGTSSFSFACLQNCTHIVLPVNLCVQNVPYVFVQSKAALGRACGVSRSVIAASITTNEAKELQSQITAIKAKIERLLI